MEYTVTFILLLGVLAGVVSWGLTQIIKTTLTRYRKAKKLGKEPWWWNPILRVTATVVGGLVGWFLAPDNWGLVIGVAGGVLNTTLVAYVKAKLKANAEDGNLGGSLTADGDDDEIADTDIDELSK